MKKSKDKAGFLTPWGNSLLNKLSSQARNNRKRNASKRRRKSAGKEIEQAVAEMLPVNIFPWSEAGAGKTEHILTLAGLETKWGQRGY
ncbi:MAG: hypothetical protein COB26_10255 [Piscirickettsiaceae bacterium]|nr:MAG: hypothetical protein COB26_10255 [Piscirickettsiaceae bacterium]